MEIGVLVFNVVPNSQECSLGQGHPLSQDNHCLSPRLPYQQTWKQPSEGEGHGLWGQTGLGLGLIGPPGDYDPNSYPCSVKWV
jgi:hypothetical protein